MDKDDKEAKLPDDAVVGFCIWNNETEDDVTCRFTYRVDVTGKDDLLVLSDGSSRAIRRQSVGFTNETTLEQASDMFLAIGEQMRALSNMYKGIEQ